MNLPTIFSHDNDTDRTSFPLPFYKNSFPSVLVQLILQMDIDDLTTKMILFSIRNSIKLMSPPDTVKCFVVVREHTSIVSE